MDEVDSIGSARMEGGSSGGDSEVQRTMLELLNQLDGFEATNKIKVHFYRYQETNLIIQWDQIWTMLAITSWRHREASRGSYLKSWCPQSFNVLAVLSIEV